MGILPSLMRKNEVLAWLFTICFLTPSGIQTWNGPLLGEYTDPSSRCPYRVDVVRMLSTHRTSSTANSLHGAIGCLVESSAFLKSSTPSCLCFVDVFGAYATWVYQGVAIL